MIVTLLFVANIVSSSLALCPPGTIQGLNQNSCYLYVNEPSSWYVAEDDCSQRGGHLASVPDGFTNSFFCRSLCSSARTYALWLGASNASGPWTWIDGSRFSYTNWAKGQPASCNASLCLRINTSSGKWYSDDCNAEKPYVCRLLALGGNDPGDCPTPKPVAKLLCPVGWTYYDFTDKCYKAFHDGSFRNWTYSEQQCVSHGDHLTSVHSYEEQVFIQELARTGMTFPGGYDTPPNYANAAWIGFNDFDQRDVFQWSDGTHMDFAYWGPNRPQKQDGASVGYFVPDWWNDTASNGWFNRWNNDPPTLNARASVCKIDVTRV